MSLLRFSSLLSDIRKSQRLTRLLKWRMFSYHKETTHLCNALEALVVETGRLISLEELPILARSEPQLVQQYENLLNRLLLILTIAHDVSRRAGGNLPHEGAVARALRLWAADYRRSLQGMHKKMAKCRQANHLPLWPV